MGFGAPPAPTDGGLPGAGGDLNIRFKPEMTMKPGFALLTFLMLFALTGHALAGEEDFDFGTGMPPIEGKAIRTVERADKASGLTFSQTIYRHDTSSFTVSTFVVEASCADPDKMPSPSEPYIIAVKYQPKSPKTFAVAGLHDIYRDVFARDREQSIRIYRNMGGREMIELTETFRPACLGI